MRNISLKSINIILIILSLLLIGLYFYQFGSNGLSNNTTDWANFGVYMTPVFMTLTILVMFYTIQEGQKRDDALRRLHKFEELLMNIRQIDDLFTTWQSSYQTMHNANLEIEKLEKQDEIDENQAVSMNYEAKHKKDAIELKSFISKSKTLINIYFLNELGAFASTQSVIIEHIIDEGYLLFQDNKNDIEKLFGDIITQLTEILLKGNITFETDLDTYTKLINQKKKIFREEMGMPKLK